MKTSIKAAALLAVLALAGNAKAADLENTIYLDLKDGRVVIELRPDLAPKTVARMKDLTRQHFPRDEMALMPKQILQQLEFARGQIEESITARGAARHEVQLQVGSL